MLRFVVKPTITEKREGGRKREEKGGGQSCFLLAEMTPRGSCEASHGSRENFFGFFSPLLHPYQSPPIMLLLPEGSVAPGLTRKVKVISP